MSTSHIPPSQKHTVPFTYKRKHQVQRRGYGVALSAFLNNISTYFMSSTII